MLHGDEQSDLGVWVYVDTITSAAHGRCPASPRCQYAMSVARVSRGETRWTSGMLGSFFKKTDPLHAMRDVMRTLMHSDGQRQIAHTATLRASLFRGNESRRGEDSRPWRLAFGGGASGDLPYCVDRGRDKLGGLADGRDV